MTHGRTPTPRPTPPRADHSLDYSPLTYADPTGNTAVRNLTGDVSITWPDGFTLRIPASAGTTLVALLAHAFTFQQSRKSHVWAKEKAPRQGNRGASNSQTKF